MRSKCVDVFIFLTLLIHTIVFVQRAEPKPIRSTQQGSLKGISSFGGAADTMRRSGTLAFLSRPYSVSIVDLSDPTNLRDIGHVSTISGSVPIMGLAAVENLLFVPLGFEGLKTFDISRLEDPESVDVLPGFHVAKGVDVRDTWVYVAAADRISIIDASDLSAPRVRSTIAADRFFHATSDVAPDFSEILSVSATAGEYLFVYWMTFDFNTMEAEVFYAIVDVHDSQRPQITSSKKSEPNMYMTPKIIGDRLFFPLSSGGLGIFEVTEEGKLAKLTEIVPGDGKTEGWLLEPALDGDLLYVPLTLTHPINSLSDESGKPLGTPILAYDISDVSNPRLVLGDPETYQSPIDDADSGFVHIMGETLFYENQLGQLVARDLRAPGFPVLSQTQEHAPDPVAIASEGSIVQTVDNYQNRFRMFDHRLPDSPRLIGTASIGASSSNIANFGNTVLSNRTILDVADPGSPRVFAELSISIPNDDPPGGTVPEASIAVTHQFAHRDGVYALAEVSGNESMIPYLISYAVGGENPLEQIASIPLATTPHVAALGDRYLVVASGNRSGPRDTGNGTIAIYDVSNPATPTLHSTTETDAVDALAIDGNRFYAATMAGAYQQRINMYNIVEETVVQLSHYIRLDNIISKFTATTTALRANSTYLIARDGVLYGAFTNVETFGLESEDYGVQFRNFAVAFIVESSERASHYLSMTLSDTPVNGMDLTENRLILSMGKSGYAIYEVPICEPDPDEEPRELESGSPVEGSLSFSGDVDTYRFSALPEQEVTIAVEAAEGSTLDPIIELVDGLGRLLTVNDDGPNRPDSLLIHTLPPQGSGFNNPFQIRVTAPGGPPNRSVGDYRVTLTLGSAPQPKPTPTPRPVVTSEDYTLTTIQRLRRTNGDPVTFTIQCLQNPEIDARNWWAEIAVELEPGFESYFEDPTIDPSRVHFPGIGTVTLVPSGDFFNPNRRRLIVRADITARMWTGNDSDTPLIQAIPVFIDMVPSSVDLQLLPETVDTVLREPVQIYIATTSRLSESNVGDRVEVFGRISPNPDVLKVDVSLEVEGTERKETQTDVYISAISGMFKTSFAVESEDELNAGDWIVQARFDNSYSRTNPAFGKSPRLRIPVGKLRAAAKGPAAEKAPAAAVEPIPGIGRAFVAFGPAPRPELESSWRALYETTVRILKERQFTDTTLSAFNSLDDTPATVAQLEASLAASADADVYTAVLAGPNADGISGSIQLSDSEIIHPDQISLLMKDRHDVLQAAGKTGETVFVIDTHQAGIIREQMAQNGLRNFIDGPDGYILTSTGEKHLNIALYGNSPDTGEFISYSRFLMDAVAKGLSIGEAHEQAASSLTRLQGPVVFAYPQPIPAMMPGRLRDVFFGLTVHQVESLFDLPDLNAPRIIETSEDQNLLPGQTPTLSVLAEDESTLDASEISIHAVITAPADGANPPAQNVVQLSFDTESGRHYAVLTDFPTTQFGSKAQIGKYAVALYAKDAAGNLSTVNSLTLTVLGDEPTPTPTPPASGISPWRRF